MGIPILFSTSNSSFSFPSTTLFVPSYIPYTVASILLYEAVHCCSKSSLKSNNRYQLTLYSTQQLYSSPVRRDVSLFRLSLIVLMTSCMLELSILACEEGVVSECATFVVWGPSLCHMFIQKNHISCPHHPRLGMLATCNVWSLNKWQLTDNLMALLSREWRCWCCQTEQHCLPGLPEMDPYYYYCWPGVGKQQTL